MLLTKSIVAALSSGGVAIELVEELEAGAREVADYFRHLDPIAARTLPITASEHPGGRPWTSKDHLAHLVARERDFLEIASRVVAREPNPIHLEQRGSTAQERAAHVHRENQVAVEDRRDVTLSDLLEELFAAEVAAGISPRVVVSARPQSTRKCATWTGGSGY